MSSAPRAPLGIQYYRRYGLLACDGLDHHGEELTRTLFAWIRDFNNRDLAKMDADDEINTNTPDGLWWSAEYPAFKSTIRIHAMHMAASLGDRSMMRLLIKKFGDDIVNKRAILRPEGREDTDHYTPLMSALFMSKTKAVLELLELRADANTENTDGLTPFHLLAQFGLPEESADIRVKSIGDIIDKLVEKKGDLQHKSGEMPDRTDWNAVHTRCRTPLSIAVQNHFSYPKQALHLLTISWHGPSEGRLFEEVNTIAKVNPNAADLLLTQMRKLDISKVRKQLQTEVQALIENEGDHLGTFVETLRKSPAAAVKLLDFLLVEPRLSDPQRYPLPLYTHLPNRRVIATYQRAAQHDGQPFWGSSPEITCQSECAKCQSKDGRGCKNEYEPRDRCAGCLGITATVLRCSHRCGFALCEDCERKALPPLSSNSQNTTYPKWHSIFKQDLPDDSLAHLDVYEVLVRVLHLPGVISFPVLSVLSMVPHSIDQKKHRIFSEASVNGIIDCAWQQFWPLFKLNLIHEIFIVLALLFVGLYPEIWQMSRVSNFFSSILLERWISSVLNLIFGLQACDPRADRANLTRANSAEGGDPSASRISPQALEEQSRGTVSRMRANVQSRAKELGKQYLPEMPESEDLLGLPGGMRPWAGFFVMFGLRDILNIVAISLLFIGLLFVRRFDIPSEDGFVQVLVTSNTLLQSFGVIAMLRNLSVIGPLILAVVYSFVPMRSMFLLMGMAFATFSCAFLILRDADRSIYFVLIYLYQGLILNDRDAQATISGLDLAQEQTLDFHKELFTGGGHESIKQFTLLVSVAASSLFSLVLLSLTIGMYTKFYEQIEPEAEALLQQVRCKRCVSYMMQPAWRLARMPRLWPWWRLLAALATCLLLYMMAVLLDVGVLIPAVLLLASTLLLQVLLMYYRVDIGKQKHFLWVAFRANNDVDQDEEDSFRKEWDVFRKQSQDSTSELRNACASLDSAISELRARAG